MPSWWTLVLVGGSYLPLTMAVGRWERARGRVGWDGQLLDAPAGRHWWHGYAPFVACYLYVALLVVLEYGVFSVWRWALLNLVLAVTGSGANSGFLYGVCLILLVMVLLLVALAAEPYLRSGVERRRLLGRFNRLAAGCLVSGALGFALTALLTARRH